jgi:hypothetical protein
MKYVFPEMIVAQSRHAGGTTNSVMGGMFIDMVQERSREVQRPISFLFLNDEQNLASLYMRFTQYFGNNEHYHYVVGYFDKRVKLVSVAHSAETGDHTAKIKAIVEFAMDHPEDEIWVYVDTQRTFRLACTSPTGMVVPFTVETSADLAGVFAAPNVRLRYAGLALTLGGRPE